MVVIEDDDDDDKDKKVDLEEDEEDDDEEEEEEPDPYTIVAKSEFMEGAPNDTDGVSPSGNIIKASDGGKLITTTIDWGGALERLRERVQDVESGDSQNPSKVLFRLMSSESPNQAIGSFVSNANPQVVEAMSGAVGSLLGGLSHPQSGVEMIVKASGEKIGSLCFQLQMTGYMFRNAEYVMALKEIMDISGSATLDDYKYAFDKLDQNGSGYIEAMEVKTLLDDVYKGETPFFEIEAFVKFFDQDKDGRVSWEEFKRGLGAAMAQNAEKKSKLKNLLSPSGNRNGMKSGNIQNDEEDEEDELPELDATVSGRIEVELEDGETVEVDAAEYIKSLRKEAQLLKDELRREKGAPDGESGQVSSFLAGGNDIRGRQDIDSFGGIAKYIASRQGDIKALTEGISPEIVQTMKMLVDFVLEGGESGKGRKMPKKRENDHGSSSPCVTTACIVATHFGLSTERGRSKGGIPQASGVDDKRLHVLCCGNAGKKEQENL